MSTASMRLATAFKRGALLLVLAIVVCSVALAPAHGQPLVRSKARSSCVRGTRACVHTKNRLRASHSAIRFPTATDGGRITRRPTVTRHAANASPPVYSTAFAGHPHAISMTFNFGHLLVVGGDATPTECSNQVMAYDTAGNASTFATLPTQPNCLGSELEDSLITVPSGLPGWPAGTTYVARGSQIYTLASDGTVTPFASSGCIDNEIVDSTFDTVGTFGNQLIISCASSAKIFTVSPTGTTTLLANVPYFGEGGIVAPPSFPTYGGQLILPGENKGTIYALSSTGTISVVGTWPNHSPEQILTVPSSPCEFAGGSLFTASPPGDIIERPASAFAGLAGDLLVADESGSGGFGVLSGPGTPSALDNPVYRSSYPPVYESSAWALCLSADASLSALSLSTGTLSPSFSPGTTSYSATVDGSASTITLTPRADNPGALIKVNGASVASGNASAPIPLAMGANTITVAVTSQDGSQTQTYTITVTRQLKGSWVGQVGVDGYDLAGWNNSSDNQSLPASVSLAQGSRWVWTSSTADTRALQSPDQSTRRAATYYDPNEVRVVLNFAGSWSGNLHLYAVDWDSAGRRETITVNGQTTSLNSDFSQGAWVNVPLAIGAAGGSVTITVDKTAGVNAVLSGIFLGDSGPPPGVSSQSPQGAWSGQLGSVGYDLAAWNGSTDNVSLPSALNSLNVTQGSRWVWQQATTDPRALQSANASSREAATYYDPNEIRVVLTFGSGWSGSLHLYALDWDSAGRRETVTVNGQTTTLGSDFSQGAWVTVPLNVASGGSVTVTIDRSAGPNAVLSGLFLGDAGPAPASRWAVSPQGSWVGQTGSGGYDLAGGGGSLPAAISSLNLAQGSRYTWAATTNDGRALQTADQTTRSARTYYDNSEVRVTLSFTGSWSGNLRLYAVDYDAAGRRETITVNGQSTSLNSDFSQGAWVVVPVSVPSGGGTVTITVDRVIGPNAVLSGIFFGDTGAPLANGWTQSAQGSWVGQFGSAGYDLAAWNGATDLTSLPAALTSLALAQGSRWIWWPSSIESRVLQSPDQSTRKAATYYDPNEVRVVLTFNAAWTGNLRLYALDLDSAGRRETITVNGQSTYLNSDFSQGAWATFPLNVAAGGGTVTITVDHTAGANAVLSGVFFDSGTSSAITHHARRQAGQAPRTERKLLGGALLRGSATRSPWWRRAIAAQAGRRG